VQTVENHELKPPEISSKHRGRLKVIGAVLTVAGIALFGYFVYTVGFQEILDNVDRFGFVGFAVILGLYFARILLRAASWKLCVYEPYYLKMKDTVPAVIMGEALSSIIPLGILISGTAKAVAVRNRLPLVVGLSSVATENLFYSVTTSIFLILGALTMVRTFDLEETWVLTIDVLICVLSLVIVFLSLLVIRQWHFISETCEWLYRKGIARGILEHGRMQVRLFENFIYGFYRRYPKRFLPIFLMQAVFHLLGVLEAWFVLSRIGDAFPQFVTAFLLESVSRLITVVFKLVPFLIGVDEAGAQFVAETLGIGAGIGVTLAIIRKARILFWAAVGIILIATRGLPVHEMLKSKID